MRFAPTVYEHGATLLGKTVSEVAQSDTYVIAAQQKAEQLYRPDLLTVGVDIYNVEYEALGGHIRYFSDQRLPEPDEGMLTDTDALLAFLEETDAEACLTRGRLPLFRHAARSLRKTVDPNREVLASVTGPFTLAVMLRGYEDLIMDLIAQEESAERLLAFTSDFVSRVGRSYIECGVGVCMNESYICPPLLSPGMFRETVMPLEAKVTAALYCHNARTVSLISGGDTTSIYPDLLKTGSNLLMADSNCNIDAIMEMVGERDVDIRGNVSSKDLLTGNFEKIESDLNRLYHSKLSQRPSNLIGCGIVPLTASVESVIHFRDLTESVWNR